MYLFCLIMLSLFMYFVDPARASLFVLLIIGLLLLFHVFSPSFFLLLSSADALDQAAQAAQDHVHHGGDDAVLAGGDCLCADAAVAHHVLGRLAQPVGRPGPRRRVLVRCRLN